jgi:hypothetical protein
VSRAVRRLALCGLGVALLPSLAGAQSAFDLDPSLALMQVYDDNLFAQPSEAQSDLVLRLSPRLGARYRSPSLAAHAHYAIDAERYLEHAELNTARARQEAAVGVRGAATRRLDYAFGASYTRTRTPGELNVVSGLAAGRAEARRLQAAGEITVRLGARTSATFDPAFTRDELAGRAETTDEMAAGLGLERRLDPASSGRLAYRYRRFTFDGGAEPTHVLTAGWTRRLGAASRIDLSAGPRLGSSGAGAEVSLGWRRRLRRGELGLSYLRTQSTALGQAGPVEVDGVAAVFSRQVARPLRLVLAPGVFRSSGEGLDAIVYRIALDAAWKLNRRLTLTGSHQFSLQRGGPGARPGEEVTHNAVLLSIVSGS